LGNLNKFYLMGRVARVPAAAAGADGRQVVSLAVTPGTSGRPPRGSHEALVLEAIGAQANIALGLRVGQGVFLRGQLRQEPSPGGSALVARVQAIELLAGRGRGPRPEGSGEGEAAGEGGPGESGGRGRGRGRRRGRGRGRGPRREDEGAPAGGEGAPAGGEGAPAGGDAAAPAGGGEASGGRSAPAADLPPPAPIAPPKPVDPPPDPTYKSDMPF